MDEHAHNRAGHGAPRFLSPDRGHLHAEMREPRRHQMERLRRKYGIGHSTLQIEYDVPLGDGQREQAEESTA